MPRVLGEFLAPGASDPWFQCRGCEVSYCFVAAVAIDDAHVVQHGELPVIQVGGDFGEAVVRKRFEFDGRLECYHLVNEFSQRGYTFCSVGEDVENEPAALAREHLEDDIEREGAVGPRR